MADRESASDRAPSPVDRHVGARIRMRRKSLGLSQEKLADALGITFQQIQKYERGTNRVSASKLYEVARTLQLPVQWFFEDAPGGDAAGQAEVAEAPSSFVHDPIATREGMEIAQLLPKMSPGVRRRLLELIRALAKANA